MSLQDRMRLMRRYLPFLVIVSISCGPFFYQAPPPLAEYPERLATKRWQDLFLEDSPRDPAVPQGGELDTACLLLHDILGPLEIPARLAQIDRLLELNRSGDYSADRANLLLEARELATDPEAFAVAERYFTFRAGDRLPRKFKPVSATRPWDMPEEDYERLKARQHRELAGRDRLLQGGLVSDAPQMRPYWRVRQAAVAFQRGRYQEALDEFSAVITDFPEHPRAEAARLMRGRCHLELFRAFRRSAQTGPWDDREEAAATAAGHLAQAGAEFDLVARPNGRFLPDAHGWLGAVAFEQGNFGSAVRHQLDRLELQPTRQVLGNVLRECDFIFRRLLEGDLPEDVVSLNRDLFFDAAAVARHPLVARLFVQHALDPAAEAVLASGDNESSDRGAINFLRERTIKPKPFLRVALRELGRKLSKDRDADETTLTVLAWAAAEEGELEQALALLDRIASPAPRDEALHGRAIFLQRLGRDAEALEAWDRLADVSPGSPLLRDLPFRRVTLLTHAGRHGAAILELAALTSARDMDQVPRHDGSRPALHPPHRFIQWLDTLLQFAPLAELEAALENLAPHDPRQPMIRDMLRTRAFARRDFALAARHLATHHEEERPEDDPHYYFSQGLRLDPATWETRIAPLAGFYQKLETTPEGSGRERLHLSIARHWMKHRGFITLPALGIHEYGHSEPEKLDLLRRSNGIELGFAAEAVNRELDARDEAIHALEHALAAATSSDPDVGAAALELANHCLFRLAEFSLFRETRAIELNHSVLSQDLDRRLRERFPETAQAKASVAYRFTPSGELWMPGNYASWRAGELLAHAAQGRHVEIYSFATDPEEESALAEIAELAAPFAAPEAGQSLEEFVAAITAARARLHELRPLTSPIGQGPILAVVDRLDDLAAAAAVPGATVEDLIHYAAGRHDGLPEGFASLIEFRRIAGRDTEGAFPRWEWTEFLKNHPDSPKAEAASLRLVRATARDQRSHTIIRGFPFPDAPIPGGYKRVWVDRPEPGDPQVVLTAIADHERRFPNGRYRDDLDLLRAGALVDAGDLADALGLLERILATPHQRDLHALASRVFAEIAQRLDDPASRAPAVDAFRAHPAALERLSAMARSHTFLARLRPMLPWLRETLAD